MGELCRDTRRGGNVRMCGVVAREHVCRGLGRKEESTWVCFAWRKSRKRSFSLLIAFVVDLWQWLRVNDS